MVPVQYIVSPFATVKWIEGERVLLSPLTAERLVLGAGELRLLDAMGREGRTADQLGRDFPELNTPQRRTLLSKLERLGIIHRLEGSEEERSLFRQRTTRRGLAEVACLNTFQEKYANTRSAFLGRPVDDEGNPVPWFSFPAVEFLRQLDLSEKTVFEYGAGNSTLYWGRVARRVIAVESNPEWWGLLAPQAPSNVSLLLRDGPSFAESIQEHDHTFDIIVIDGSVSRYDCARVAPPKLARGGMIILDDSETMPHSATILREAGLIQIDFAGFSAFEAAIQTISIMLHREFNFPPLGGRQPYKILGGLGTRSLGDLPFGATSFEDDEDAAP